MHRHLRAVVLVALALGSLTVASGAVVHADSTSAPRHQAAVVTTRIGVPTGPLATSRPGRLGLLSFAALVASLLLAVTTNRRLARQRPVVRPATPASVQAPTRAPPLDQRFAF